jgi:hypothetical protein
MSCADVVDSALQLAYRYDDEQPLGPATVARGGTEIAAMQGRRLRVFSKPSGGGRPSRLETQLQRFLCNQHLPAHWSLRRSQEAARWCYRLMISRIDGRSGSTMKFMSTSRLIHRLTQVRRTTSGILRCLHSVMVAKYPVAKPC